MVASVILNRHKCTFSCASLKLLIYILSDNLLNFMIDFKCIQITNPYLLQIFEILKANDLLKCLYVAHTQFLTSSYIQRYMFCIPSVRYGDPQFGNIKCMM